MLSLQGPYIAGLQLNLDLSWNQFVRTVTPTDASTCEIKQIWQTQSNSQQHVWLHSPHIGAHDYQSQRQQIQIRDLHSALNGIHTIDKIDSDKSAIGIKRQLPTDLDEGQLVFAGPGNQPTFRKYRQVKANDICLHRVTLRGYTIHSEQLGEQYIPEQRFKQMLQQAISRQLDMQQSACQQDLCASSMLHNESGLCHSSHVPNNSCTLQSQPLIPCSTAAQNQTQAAGIQPDVPASANLNSSATMGVSCMLSSILMCHVLATESQRCSILPIY